MSLCLCIGYSNTDDPCKEYSLILAEKIDKQISYSPDEHFISGFALGFVSATCLYQPGLFKTYKDFEKLFLNIKHDIENQNDTNKYLK